ncbi:MAG: hypothetical protein WD116_03735, partial [Chloroflexota bacterium]
MTVLSPGADERVAAPPANLWRDTLHNILRQRVAQAGLFLLGILLFMAVAAPLISTHDPTDTIGIDEGLLAPGAPPELKGPCIRLLGCNADRPEHYLGIDRNGRDVYSRVVYGAQISLYIGFVTVG